MVKTDTDDTDELTTCINHLCPCSLVVVHVPLLCTVFHLCVVVGSQGQMLQMTTSHNWTQHQEVLEGQLFEGSFGASGILDLIVDSLWDQIGGVWIVMCGASILLVVQGLELLEALHLGVVGISSEGDKSRGRRSVGSRHFVWRTGWQWKGQWLTLLLGAYPRHALL